MSYNVIYHRCSFCSGPPHQNLPLRMWRWCLCSTTRPHQLGLGGLTTRAWRRFAGNLSLDLGRCVRDMMLLKCLLSSNSSTLSPCGTRQPRRCFMWINTPRSRDHDVIWRPASHIFNNRSLEGVIWCYVMSSHVILCYVTRCVSIYDACMCWWRLPLWCVCFLSCDIIWCYMMWYYVI